MIFQLTLIAAILVVPDHVSLFLFAFPLNELFDHNLHEAISSVESEGQEGLVVQVIQAGYTIANRLIRPALVAVSKAKISS